MQKLASSIVQEGALTVEDAVGWVTRLAATLELIQVHGRAHGRVSAKAVQILGRNCTAAGFFLDTADLVDDVAYHSPDRIAGAKPSPGDDTWALGVMLYFALTGQLPFAGMSTESVGAEMLVAEVTPLADFGVADARLQQVIDVVFSWDPKARLQTARALRNVLCEAFPFAAALPPLKLGKPKIALFDDEDEADDDEGQKLTAVLQDDPDILQARLEHAKSKAAAKRSAPAAPPPSFEAQPQDEALDEDPGAGIVDELSIGDLPVLPAAPSSATAGGPGLQRARRRDADSSSPDAPGQTEVAPSRTARGEAPQPFAAAGAGAYAPAPAAHSAGAGGYPAAPSARAVPDPLPYGEPPPAVGAPSPLGAPAAPAVPYAEPPSAARPALAASPTLGRRTAGNRRLADTVLGLLFLAVGGLGSYLLLGSQPIHGAGSTRATTSASATLTSSAASPAASASSPSAGPSGRSAAPSPSASASVGPVRPGNGDLTACMLTLFPAGTFPSSSKVKFDSVCKETDARKGGHALRVQVVKAGGAGRGPSEGMHEWSLFGWYEMPAFVVARTACCKDPPKLATGLVPKSCLLDAALAALGTAAVSTDDKALQEALRGYRDIMTCLMRAGATIAFGQSGPPDPGAATTFDQFVARLHKAQGR